MSQSNLTTVPFDNNENCDGDVIPRMYGLRFDSGLSHQTIDEMLEKWNEAFACLPGTGYFSQTCITEPHIDSVTGKRKNLKVFYLQASTIFWDAFTSKQCSFGPSIDNIILKGKSTLHVSSL